ncbi:uncharacterized protein LOC141638271 [Silene latifolia]|uniref:uncharacterized protein LOC141638271 n=1 Tax=Silene latifolia TaxID=37657 RepID=UPI003D786234
MEAVVPSSSPLREEDSKNHDSKPLSAELVPEEVIIQVDKKKRVSSDFSLTSKVSMVQFQFMATNENLSKTRSRTLILLQRLQRLKGRRIICSSSKIIITHPSRSIGYLFRLITLETENVHYASWAELFLNTASAVDVIDHLVPPKDAVIEKDATWKRLDAIVKQWIYSTISVDLLHTILEPGSTAQTAWDRLKDIFNDNKHTRAVMLEQQFTNTHMDNYPNVSSYCQALKMIADQLANVGSPVSEPRLVLQLVTHVSDGFKGIATIIQQKDPLPPFYKARSMLALEESNQRITAPATADTALLASQQSKDSDSKPLSNSNSYKGNGNSNSNINRGKGGRNNYCGQNRNKNNGGNSSSSGRNNGNNRGGNNNQQGTWTWVPFNSYQQGWGAPPCPYPTAGWTAPSRPQQGILGPRPSQTGQAFFAQPGTSSTSGAFVPTGIAAMMQSLGLQQPDDNYYMDTGASSHMTSNSGNLSSYSFLSKNRHIVVGNGDLIPIIGHGAMSLASPYPPLLLNNVLHVPNLIKNLVSVRKFTIDNHVSVEFDPFGFTVKDLKTGMPIMRSNSTGDLYPLHASTQAKAASYLHVFTAIPSPITALHDPNWNRAMNDEFDALIKNETWILVPRPPNVNITRCHWLFKHKFKANGDFERYKARLVVNGRSQQVGVDCDETFSPVAKPATIRTVLSLAVSNKWPIHQLNVKNAFLHGHLTETVYMHQPPGFKNKNRPNDVCLLKKSLYGLKQAPRAWYQRFATYASSIGFVHSKSDNSLFIFSDGTNMAYLLLYVDDIILTTSSIALRDKIMALFRAEFAMTDLGPLNFFLGVAATRHDHGLFLHQSKYATDIINRAQMSNCKPA